MITSCRSTPISRPDCTWYHPHPHGLTDWQAGNGMAGAIVVEGIAGEVPQAAGLRERVIVLGDPPNDPTCSAKISAVTRRRRQPILLSDPYGLIALCTYTNRRSGRETIVSSGSGFLRFVSTGSGIF